MRRSNVRTIAVIAALAGLWLAGRAFPAPPQGADPNSPTATWFRSLRQPWTGASCCDVADCRITASRPTGSRWEARAPDGEWVSVPPSRVLSSEVHPRGVAVLCARQDVLPHSGWEVLCFVPPSASG